MKLKYMNIYKPFGLFMTAVLITACQSQSATPTANAPATGNAQNRPQGAQSAQNGRFQQGQGGQAQGTPQAGGFNPAQLQNAEGTPSAVPTRIINAVTTIPAEGTLALTTPIINLSFETSGKVAQLNVKPGQRVAKGDVLALLDEQTLKDALDQAREQLRLTEAQIKEAAVGTPVRKSDIDSAQASLNTARTRLTEAQRGAAKTDIDQAKALLSVAQMKLDQVKAGATASEKEAALRSWNTSKNSLWSAQLSRDANCARDQNTVQCKSSQAQVGNAFESERAAYAKYQETLQPPTTDKVRAAEADVSSAQSRLNTLLNQNSPEKLASYYADVISAEARLKQLTESQPVTDEKKKVTEIQLDNARSSVERAERNLAKAKLISPCDCIVQDVNVVVGSNASATAVTLVDTGSVVFKTSNISERDLASVKVGNVATVRLKAYDKNFNGKVSAILPQSSGMQGTTAIFTVLIKLDDAKEDLFPGMTGQAQIQLR
jgi:multidrug resistance efflux pump